MPDELAVPLAGYYPGVQALIQERGLNLSELVWGRTIWPIATAKHVLDYQPQYNFDGFLHALAAGDTACYPFAGLDKVLPNFTVRWEREGGATSLAQLFFWRLSATNVADSRQKEIFIGGSKTLQTTRTAKRIAAKRNLVLLWWGI